MKIIKIDYLFVLAFVLVYFSCSSQKQILETEPTTITKSDELKFDLSFIDRELKKSYVDSLGHIIINDSMLNIKLRVALHLKVNDFITTGIADSITSLDLSCKTNASNDQKIKKIDALAFFAKLKKLNLGFNVIENISSLGNLENLEELQIQNNKISDISSLGKLSHLRHLNLYANNVSDISALSNLFELSDLNLWSNGISDINSLGGLKNLTYLNLGNNYIKDISPLQNCKGIKTLWLYRNPLINPEIISVFSETLEELSIANCNITDIGFLENCNKLRTLLIFDNRIKDISALHKMNYLNVLLASSNLIENIDVVAYLVNKGAFQKTSRYRKSINEVGANIDLTNNKIDYQKQENEKIRRYLSEKVKGVKL